MLMNVCNIGLWVCMVYKQRIQDKESMYKPTDGKLAFRSKTYMCVCVCIYICMWILPRTKLKVKFTPNETQIFVVNKQFF